MHLREAVLILAALPITTAINQPVKVEGGLVSGVRGRDPSIMTFKGIPYAAPPVQGRRWLPPGPVASWQGVRTATQFAPNCVQNILAERKPWTWEFMVHGEVSEDCLYVNVWTGAKSAAEKHPVYVYIHGGSFTEGSGSAPVFDGEGLVRKGLVVVTLNYRLAAFGYLAHPELTKESPVHASGNYGLLDQIAAVRWVHRNIANFGGDPNRITIAGQSAGAMSVHYLVASPLSRGTFQRAVMESGGSSLNRGGVPASAGPLRLADAEAQGQKFAESLGAPTLKELRELPWQKLMMLHPSEARARGGAVATMRFWPIIDGYSLVASPLEIFAQGKQNDVVTLTGVNKDELGGSGATSPQGAVTVASFRQWAQGRYGAMTEEFLKLYSAATDEQVKAAQTEGSRDQALVSMYLWAKARSKTAKTPAYLYLWDHPMPGPDVTIFGAFHNSEIPYAMNSLYASDRPFLDLDWKIADIMSGYWANLTARGDPNGRGLPVWKPVGDKPEIQQVGEKNAPIPVAGSAEKFAFFERFFAK
jgi:para-nitrobenzyl esterase